MNEKIDLTKILKDCQIGWKFYSSVYGDVEFVEIYRKPVLCNQSPREEVWLGSVIHDCEHPIRFWSTNGSEHSVSRRGEMIKGCGECTFFPSKDQRDWSKFTAPWYKKEKFDPKTLKPFDKVLARDYLHGEWTCGFFSHIVIFDNICKYNVGEILYTMCIPYNDDTKPLVGTTDEAPEYYRYWEDLQ